MSEAAHAAVLRLDCHPSKAGDVLVFPYALRNQGPGDVYAMHALPGADPASGAARADETAAIVIASPDGDAIIGKFIAPLPTDRRIALPVTPLARLLRAGETLEGRLELPEPLAETSPYFADLTLRKYQMIAVRGVVFTIGYWPATERTPARPCEYASDLFEISLRDPARSARRVAQRFPATGLHLFKRTDAFPRVLG